uniref:CSN8/PSMD8/EIF3K domain-containing protein n=1 Tax=Solanum lycopersicum TaxID=4081 RepID=A0A3Q7FAS5_SOLLC
RGVGDGVEGESTTKKTVRFNGYFSTQRSLGGAAEGIEFQDEWPYAIHLLGHIYSNDINSARFLWKKIPAAVKEARPEVVAVWRIGQKLWTRDYVGVHEAIRGFSWKLYRKRMFELLLSAYSTISTQDSAHFLGMNENDATNYVLQQGWALDSASQMLTVKKQAVLTEQKLDPSKLQRLTEYVFHLEH